MKLKTILNAIKSKQTIEFIANKKPIKFAPIGILKDKRGRQIVLGDWLNSHSLSLLVDAPKEFRIELISRVRIIS